MEGVNKRRRTSNIKSTKGIESEKVNKNKSNSKRVLDTKKGPSKAKKSAKTSPKKKKEAEEDEEDSDSNVEQFSDEDSQGFSESDEDETEVEEKEQPVTKKKANKDKNQSLKQRLAKYWERVRDSERVKLEDLFATIILDSHYKEKLSENRESIIPSRSKDNEKLEEYLIKIIKNIRDYYLEGGKAGLRNVFMNKEYAKEALKPYLRDIKIEEIMIADTKTEENKELTKMIIGTLMYLVTGSDDDAKKLSNFESAVEKLTFKRQSFMKDAANFSTQLKEAIKEIRKVKQTEKAALKFILDCIKNTYLKDRLARATTVKELANQMERISAKILRSVNYITKVCGPDDAPHTESKKEYVKGKRTREDSFPGETAKKAKTNQDEEWKKYQEWQKEFRATMTCHNCGETGHCRTMRLFKDEEGRFWQEWKCKKTRIPQDVLEKKKNSKEWKDLTAKHAALLKNKVSKPTKP